MSTTQPQNPIIAELEQAIADTLNVAIPAFSQVGMVALLQGFQNLITHHAVTVPAQKELLAKLTLGKSPNPNPNPAPIVVPANPPVAPIS